MHCQRTESGNKNKVTYLSKQLGIPLLTRSRCTLFIFRAMFFWNKSGTSQLKKKRNTSCYSNLLCIKYRGKIKDSWRETGCFK